MLLQLIQAIFSLIYPKILPFSKFFVTAQLLSFLGHVSSRIGH